MLKTLENFNIAKPACKKKSNPPSQFVNIIGKIVSEFVLRHFHSARLRVYNSICLTVTMRCKHS